MSGAAIRNAIDGLAAAIAADPAKAPCDGRCGLGPHSPVGCTVKDGPTCSLEILVI